MKISQRDSAIIVGICVLLAWLLILFLVVRGGVDRHARLKQVSAVAGLGEIAGLTKQPNHLQREAGPNPALAPVEPSTGRRVVLHKRDVPAPLRPLYNAIRQVESAGDDYAIGDEGDSLGPYQISSAYWADACEYAGVQWDYHELVWSRSHCEQAMSWYWQRYGAKTDEDRARLHVAGPTMKGSDEYWTKVKAIMEAN